jgi:arylformamidase
MRRLTLETVEGVWHADANRPHDLSIALRFDGAQPNLFAAPVAAASPLRSGDFIGDVSLGGSCNCVQYHLTPHCNGTHTECIGHVTRQKVSVRDIYAGGLLRSLLLSVTPTAAAATREDTDPAPQPDDRVITAESLKAAWLPFSATRANALVIRTLPNDATKLARNYEDGAPPAYLTRQAAELLVTRGIEHVLLDLPSFDRPHDEGKLTGHRIFWGLPAGSTDVTSAQRPQATITEMVYVPSALDDGRYILDLQIAPFAADAAPSRPLLYSASDAR